MSRINHYEFPENTPIEVLAQHGCTITFAPGVTYTNWEGKEVTTTDEITLTPHSRNNYGKEDIEKYGHLITKVDREIGGLTVTGVKTLIKQYGGIGWTYHCDRSGGCFEVTPITLSGNNSRFKYNRHL